MVAPLTGLLSSKVEFEWSLRCQAFKVKASISSAPVLAALRMGEPFKLHVDASIITNW